VFRVIDSSLGVTLHDLKTIYDIDELFDFLEYIDLKQEAEFLANQE